MSKNAFILLLLLILKTMDNSISVIRFQLARQNVLNHMNFIAMLLYYQNFPKPAILLIQFQSYQRLLYILETMLLKTAKKSHYLSSKIHWEALKLHFCLGY